MRYASLLGITRYDADSRFNLPDIAADLANIETALGESHFQVTAALDPPTRTHALRVLSIGPGLCRTPDDLVIVYAAGHGSDFGQQFGGVLYLTNYSATPHLLSRQAVFYEDLDIIFRGGSPGRIALFMYDACREASPILPDIVGIKPPPVPAEHMYHVSSATPYGRAYQNADGSFFVQGFTEAATATSPSATLHQVLLHTADRVALLSRGGQRVAHWSGWRPYRTDEYPWSLHLTSTPTNPVPIPIPGAAGMQARYPYVDIELPGVGLVGRLCVDFDRVTRRWLDTLIANVGEVSAGRPPSGFVGDDNKLRSRERRVLRVTEAELQMIESAARLGKLDHLPLLWVAFWYPVDTTAALADKTQHAADPRPCMARLYAVGDDVEHTVPPGSKFFNARRGTGPWMLHRVCSRLIPALLSDLSGDTVDAELTDTLDRITSKLFVHLTADKPPSSWPSNSPYDVLMDLLTKTVRSIQLWSVAGTPELQATIWLQAKSFRRAVRNYLRKWATPCLASIDPDWARNLIDCFAPAADDVRFWSTARAHRKINRQLSRHFARYEEER